MALNSRLSAYEKRNGKASIAIVGAGYVASGVLHTLNGAPGMAPTVMINRNVDRAVNAVLQLGIERKNIVISDEASELAKALANGQFAVSTDYRVLAKLAVDIVIEATGALDYGTRVILGSLEAKQHVVSYNAELDSLLAWKLHRCAEKHGVIYTIADGDQPGALFRLSEQVESMGFQVSAMLNCKRHMDIHQNPSSGADYAARDTTSNLMTTAFGDGTKMQIEQAVVANATEMPPTVRGMHGIRSTVENLTESVAELWREQESRVPNLRNTPPQGGYVDYTLGGDFGAGVGVIARHPQGEHHKKALSLYKMGDGPDYFFFRPYHLVHLELPLTIADVLLNQEALATVDTVHVATVIAVAKKELGSGEKLDGIGGYCAYGLIDSYQHATDYLPIALAEYATLVADVKQDHPIPLAAVTLDESRLVVQEWLAQSRIFQKQLNTTEDLTNA